MSVIIVFKINKTWYTHNWQGAYGKVEQWQLFIYFSNDNIVNQTNSINIKNVSGNKTNLYLVGSIS